MANQKKKKIIALDIETECVIGCTSHSKCYEKEKHALIPHMNRITCIGVFDGESGHVFRGPDLLDQVYNYLYRASEEGYEFVGHNFAFDLKQLSYHLEKYKQPLPVHWAHDTQLMAYVHTDKIPSEWLVRYEALRQEENKKLPRGVSHRKAGGLSLKTLAPYFLDVAPFWENPANHDDDEYVLKDCEYTYCLYDYFRERMADREWNFYVTKQMRWARELLQAELHGIRIDLDLVEKKRQEAERSRDVAKGATLQAWSGLIDAEFNIDSPKQLLGVMDKLGRLDELIGEEGKPTTSADVLEDYAEKYQDIKSLLEYRASSKLCSTYYPNYVKFATPEGRIHCSLNASGTRTGRISSSLPNLQNQPPSTREVFRADPGHSFIIKDVAGIEPLLAAFYSQDKNLLHVLLNGLNFHNYNVPLIFPYAEGIPNEEIKHKFPKERAVTKTAVLAILYGSGARRLMGILHKEGFIQYRESDCKQIVRRIREYYKGVWQFKEALDDVLMQGEVVYNFMGRPFTIENPDDVYMTGFNTLIQGSASDIIQEAATRYNEECRARDIASQFVLLIHDEVIVQAPEARLSECEEILSKCMTTFNLTRNANNLKINIEGHIATKWVK